MIWVLFPSGARAALLADPPVAHDPFHYPIHAAGLFCVGDPEDIVAYVGTSGPMPLCHDSIDY